MRILGLLVVSLLIAYALTGLVQVRPGERAVVRRWGRVLETKPEPGLWWGLPWGLERVDRVAVDRVQNVVVGYQDDNNTDLPMPPGQLLTGDHNLVNVQAVLYYKVRPEEVVEYVVQGEERVDALLRRVVEAEMAEWVAGREVDDVLLNGKNQLRADLKSHMGRRIAPYRLGVEILDARVERIAPPQEVKVAFDNVAQEQTKIDTRVNKAEQEAESQKRQAQAERYRQEQDTAAHIANQKLLARREAEGFLQRLRQYEYGRRTNPFYLRQIWEEERGKLFARLKENKQIDLLDHHLGPDGLNLITAPPLPQK